MKKHYKLSMSGYTPLLIIANQENLHDLYTIHNDFNNKVYHGKLGYVGEKEYKELLKKELEKNNIEFEEFEITEL